MAAEERSTTFEREQAVRRLKARQAAGLVDTVAERLAEIDDSCHDSCRYIEALANAIAKISSPDDDIHQLANQIAYWAFDVRNNVNCQLEEIGCNYIEREVAHG